MNSLGNVWDFSKPVLGVCDNKRSQIILLDKNGDAQWHDEHDGAMPELIIANDYLFSVLAELHTGQDRLYVLYHLQPASSKEIADFLIQLHVMPLMRELETIQYGFAQALAQDNQANMKVGRILNLFLKKRFDVVKKAEQRIKKERYEHRRHQEALAFSAG